MAQPKWSQELEDELKAVYKEANTDGKPGLTMKELKDFFTKYGGASEDAKEIFKAMNADGDDVLTEAEMIKYVKDALSC